MEKNTFLTWTIKDSIDLAKLYRSDSTEVCIYSKIKFNKHLENFFRAFGVPFTTAARSIKSDCAYFGTQVSFQNLYIIAGVIKSFGYNKFYYNPKINNKIILGSPKRKSITQKKCYIDIDMILSLPYDTDISSIVEVFDEFLSKPAKKLDIIDFGLSSGLITNNDLQSDKNSSQKESNEEFVEEDYDDSTIDRKNKNDRDPYENFHWGGLSGEEAHTAYWNCD